jgi:hypothetical protein
MDGDFPSYGFPYYDPTFGNVIMSAETHEIVHSTTLSCPVLYGCSTDYFVASQDLKETKVKSKSVSFAVSATITISELQMKSAVIVPSLFLLSNGLARSWLLRISQSFTGSGALTGSVGEIFERSAIATLSRVLESSISMNFSAIVDRSSAINHSGTIDGSISLNLSPITDISEIADRSDPIIPSEVIQGSDINPSEVQVSDPINPSGAIQRSVPFNQSSPVDPSDIIDPSDPIEDSIALNLSAIYDSSIIFDISEAIDPTQFKPSDFVDLSAIGDPSDIIDHSHAIDNQTALDQSPFFDHSDAFRPTTVNPSLGIWHRTAFERSRENDHSSELSASNENQASAILSVSGSFAGSFSLIEEVPQPIASPSASSESNLLLGLPLLGIIGIGIAILLVIAILVIILVTHHRRMVEFSYSTAGNEVPTQSAISYYQGIEETLTAISPLMTDVTAFTEFYDDPGPGIFDAPNVFEVAE